MTKLTLEQKMQRPAKPETKILEMAYGGMAPGQTMLIATPQEIAGYISTLPKGSFSSIAEMRAALAKKHGSHGTCPMTTGIFLRVVAEYAYEKAGSGADWNTLPPIWRVIDLQTPLARKLSEGLRVIIERKQQEEGIILKA